jgi:hypothetical protein
MAAGIASKPQDEFPKLDLSENQEPPAYFAGFQQRKSARKKKGGAARNALRHLILGIAACGYCGVSVMGSKEMV